MSFWNEKWLIMSKNTALSPSPTELTTVVQPLFDKKIYNHREIAEVELRFYNGCNKIVELSLIKVSHSQSFKHP